MRSASLALLACGQVFVFAACSSTSATDSAAPIPDGTSSATDAGRSDVEGSAPADAAAPVDASVDAEAGPPPDPCPNLPIPTTCFGRSVVYREWGASAVGDGTYFADQAPGRLGFNRVRGNIWITKFRVEANTYRGRISAYGDTSPGVAWISDKPCDATFAEQKKLTVFGNTGGGLLMFVVTRDAADAAKLAGDPPYAASPQLEGDHCYYLGFENVTDFPPALPTASYIATQVDNCGAGLGDGCYYHAQDFTHRLHDITSGITIAGNVIPGYTQP